MSMGWRAVLSILITRHARQTQRNSTAELLANAPKAQLNSRGAGGILPSPGAAAESCHVGVGCSPFSPPLPLRGHYNTETLVQGNLDAAVALNGCQLGPGLSLASHDSVLEAFLCRVDDRLADFTVLKRECHSDVALPSLADLQIVQAKLVRGTARQAARYSEVSSIVQDISKPREQTEMAICL